MIKLKSKIGIIGATIAILLLLSSISFAISGIVNNQGNKEETVLEKELSVQVKKEKTIKFLKDNGFKEHAYLSKAHIKELYKQGFGFKEIREAQKLSLICDKTPEELLKIKGQAQYASKEETDKSGKVHEEIIDKGKSWDTVIQELGIFTQDTNQILDLDKSAISELKAQGLSDNTIIDISIVSRNTKINYKEISQELNKDLTKTDLSSLAASVAMSDGIDGKETNRIDNNLEDIERIKKKYNITDDDISKCEKNGITKIEEVGFLKILSNKHSIEMDELLKIMKEEKSLEKVQQKLEVDLNAK